MPVADYTPTVDEVGARTRARTLDANGNRLGTYDDTTTRISAGEVGEMITTAVAIISAKIGAELPNEQLDAAKYAVICKTAMAIELSLAPENTNAEDSAYQTWSSEYDDAIAALQIGLQDDEPGHARVYSVLSRSPGAAESDSELTAGQNPAP